MSVGEVFLGAFVQIILQALYSLIKSKITKVDQLGTDLERLLKSFERIKGILGDVEKRQAREEELQHWLRDLRDVAYEANDLLDEIATEGLRRDSVHLHKVRDSFVSDVNPRRHVFKLKVAAKVNQIIQKIKDIPSNNGLRPAADLAGGRSDIDYYDDDDVRPTTGVLSSENPVFGRAPESDYLVQLLITDECSDKHISVIPIQGVGGIGKTTLAQLAFNHEHVSSPYFDLKMWVHVPYSSNVTRLTKLIFESAVAGHTHLSELNSLQHELMKGLTCKRYLLVLDNLWNERDEHCNGISVDWSELKKPLLVGARGSRILITTRNPTTAKITSTIGHPLVLRGLSYDDCWSVFAHHAFDHEDSAAHCERHGDLARIGRKIVWKCCGSPLAARTLGSHLRGAERWKWEYVQGGEILHLRESRDGILRSLESTYHQLPPHLKQCFRFCGIFPKDFMFERDVLVRLWMAQGYLGPIVEQAEDVGTDYFNSLVHRLFFKRAHDDPSKYVMSDLLPELAQYISRDECSMLRHNEPCSINESIRHSSLVICDNSHDQETPSIASSSSSNLQAVATIESFYKAKGLYTLLLIGNPGKCSTVQIPVKMAENLKRLRVLDLGSAQIEKLHDSIKELIHLRYLNLSSSKIRSLPESVCKLYNLQTLGLRNCTMLEKLPRNIKHLSNLRHLDLHHDDDFQMEADGVLSSMPKDIGKLSSLRTLSRFVVGKGRHCGGMKELGNLNEIHGDLRLLKLHNIHHEHEAKEAKLTEKKYLTRLELQWGDSTRSSKQRNGTVDEEIVLANLEVHGNVKELWVVGYNGASFPPWMGHSSFSNIVKVRLSNCRECKQLPPLGQLPLLKDLCIKGMDAVEYIDCGFCCGGNVSTEDQKKRNASTGFPSLRVLRFESMRNWKGWYGEKTCKLPSLRELIIMDCPVLGSLCHSFPTRAKFFSDRCGHR